MKQPKIILMNNLQNNREEVFVMEKNDIFIKIETKLVSLGVSVSRMIISAS